MKRSIDDPDLTVDDLMDTYPATVAVFLRHGMLCVGCAISPFHNVAEACAEYSLDEDSFRKELFQEVVSEESSR
jgi:hybrid cluster-associated redox disulfide protein